MKHIQTLSATVLLTLSLSATADDGDTADTNALLNNLGAYLGYQLVNTYNGDPYSALLNMSSSTNIAVNLINSVFSALPVNTFNTTLSQFMPSTTSNSSYNEILKPLNGLANATFSTAGYNSESESSSVSINPLIDQETYQNDPINQAILNILGTPNYTYCMNNDASAWLSSCDYLYNYNVTNNIVGNTPAPSDFFSYRYNQYVIPQLNGNTLIAPLLYDTTTSIGGNNAATGGLNATTQVQEAANFIRYATFGTAPVEMPSYQDYSSTYTTATTSTGSPRTAAQAQNTINSFIASLRTYAALSSVPTSNLYYILSKRMPQTTPTGDKEQTSQALNEFIMATHRLSSQPTSSGGTSWINSINTASPATVEKEIALLLAEINYQLYLNRQQEERQLLTNSLILTIMARQQAPSFGSNDDAPSTTNTTATE
jgi:intracellular multiplication protein IcmX